MSKKTTKELLDFQADLLEIELPATVNKEVVEKEVEAATDEPEAEMPKEEVAEVKDEEPAKSEEKFSDVEKEAMAKGWNPKHDSKSTGKKALSAEEFLDRGSFFEKIEGQSKQIKDLEKMVTQLSQDISVAKQKGYDKAFNEIENRKRLAVEEGDVHAYDKAQNDLQKMAVEQSKQSVQSEANAEANAMVKEFYDRNKGWYNTATIDNFEMKRHADEVDEYITLNKPGMSPKEHLMMIEMEVKKRFPDKFKSADKPKTAPNPVSKSNKMSSRGDDLPDVGSLTDVQKDLYMKARQGKVPGMTGAQYLKALKGIYGDENE